MPWPQNPIALPRSCGGNASSSTACDSGCIAPPVAPWIRRNVTSNGRFGARPHNSDERVKPVTDVINSRLRPKLRASQPVIGRMIALATRYDVSTHVDSSIVADRLPAMWGSDTLTTVVSRTSMKVASMTAISTIHGLTCLWSDIIQCSPWSPDVHRPRDAHAGATRVVRILAGLEVDLHRDALHHLHEVPGGILGRQHAELCAGRAGDAAHVAVEVPSTERVDRDPGLLARAHGLELRFLEVGGDPDL